MKRIVLVILGSVLVSSVAHAETEDDDRYYRRARGVGVFHGSRMVAGVSSGQAPDLMEDGTAVMPGATRGATQFSLGFDAVYLGVPSSFGHFHGIEVSTGVRGAPFDWWLTAGTAVTFFNLGRGGPLSLRVGGSFGAGFNFAHGFGYVRGRAAVVVVPERLDAEASITWTPPSASTASFDERTIRLSVWWRQNRRGGRAFEGYVEAFQRLDPAIDHAREFDGLGGGLGVSLF